MFVLLSHTSSFIPNTIFLPPNPPTPATLDRRDLSKNFHRKLFLQHKRRMVDELNLEFTHLLFIFAGVQSTYLLLADSVYVGRQA